ncbi:MAG: pantetheine-phosphate adenylyltransferase [Flavobacteriaceae bacterium]|nr:pantetheine-phosphate adenylyltransferase [Flavobacteriaceae bacterium]
MKIAVFPGSFDPITKGHESVIRKAIPLFDKIIIAIGVNSSKKYLFSLEKRIELIKLTFKSEIKIEVQTYKGLTVEFCKQQKSEYLLRGLRTAADFEFEKAIALTNKQINGVETIFMLTNIEHSHISSTIVRDIYKNNGDVSSFVPSEIIGVI